jgi:hypothetical protein
MRSWITEVTSTVIERGQLKYAMPIRIWNYQNILKLQWIKFDIG